MFIQCPRWMRKAAAVLLCLILTFTACLVVERPAQAKATTNSVNNSFEQEAVPAWVPTLHYGSRGASVSRVQTNLKTLGFYHHTVTGFYGSATRQAVKNFQWRYSIRVDGIAGPTTQGMISRAIVKQRIINDTYRYRGIHYVWGGKTPAGFDCSGFVYYMFRKHGVWVPYRTSNTLFHTGYYISRSRLRQGDLVFFSVNRPGVVSHVGFYMGNNTFISATSSKGIAVYSMSNPYWAPHYMGARRVY
ncbi:MAG: C40 family peptidase [Tumebacillaceae bacterium]